MPLEDLTGPDKFIDALNESWPLDSDLRPEGDDHIRGIKNVLTNTFPQATGAVDTDQPVPRQKSAVSALYAEGSADIPAGTTANAPASSGLGGLRYDTDTGKLMLWDLDSDGALTPGWKDRLLYTDLNWTAEKAVEFLGTATFRGNVSFLENPVKLAINLNMNTDDYNDPTTYPTPTSASINWRIGMGGQAHCGFRGIGYGNNVGNEIWAEVRTGGGLLVRAKFDEVGLIVGGNRIFNERFDSGGLSFTNGSATTAPHGLAKKPTKVSARLQCVTPEHGYQVGDEIEMPDMYRWQADTGGGGGNQFYRGATLCWDDTNVTIAVASNGFAVVPKAGGSEVILNSANWQIFVTAFGEGFVFSQSSEN